MKKKKKVKSTTAKTKFSAAIPLRSFSKFDQRVDQRNYRTAKINMPRRPK